MRLRKTLAIVACAGLLSTAAIVSPRHAYAQDADSADPEEGAWSADEVNPPDSDSEPSTAKPPLDVQGCWSGKVHDRAKGRELSRLHFSRTGPNSCHVSAVSAFFGIHTTSRTAR
jgi:hypothetical protein